MRSFQSGGRGRGGGMNQPVEKPVHFWQTIGRLFGYLGNYRAGVIVSLVITAISVVLSVRAPKVLGEATTVIFDDVTKSMRQHTALHIQMDKVVQILMLVSALYLIAALFDGAIVFVNCPDYRATITTLFCPATGGLGVAE